MNKRYSIARGLRQTAVCLILSCLCCSIVIASPFEEDTTTHSGGGGGGVGLGNPNEGGGSQNACGALLCLAGVMMTGQNPGSCSSYITSYFTIIKTKDGIFSPSKTLSARANFLNQCGGSDSQTKSQVNSKYGSVLGL